MRSLWMKGMLWMRRDWGGTEDKTGDRTFRRDGAKGVVVVGKVLKGIICKITGNSSGHSWVLCCKQRSLNPLENIPFLLPLVLPGDGNPRVTPAQLRLVLGSCCVWPTGFWMMLQRKLFVILFHSAKGVEGPSTTFQGYNAGDKVKVQIYSIEWRFCAHLCFLPFFPPLSQTGIIHLHRKRSDGFMGETAEYFYSEDTQCTDVCQTKKGKTNSYNWSFSRTLWRLWKK